MKLRSVALAATLAGACLLSACATNTARFEWGGYEGALYAYAKAPDKRPGYETALENAIERGRKTNKVAPGLCAELGFAYLEDGDSRRAVVLFEEEMQRFPESRSFLTEVVARAKVATAPASAESKS